MTEWFGASLIMDGSFDILEITEPLIEGITPNSEPIEVIPHHVTPEEYQLFFEPLFASSTYDPTTRIEITNGGCTIIHGLVVEPSPAQPVVVAYQADDAVVPYHPDASLPHDHAACEQVQVP